MAAAAELRHSGRALRADVPRSAHGAWRPAPGRADPVGFLAAASRSWLAELVAVRYERMLVSPLAFLRGAAAIMAADLAASPVTGLRVQAVGDAHLLNFGGFGTPERRLLFDVDDFDETFPGPWEWDVKRLATSAAVAARELGGDDRAAATAAARGYREAIARFAGMTALEIHGFELEAGAAARLVRGLGRDVTRWSHQTSRWELPRLTAAQDGVPRIRPQPPLTAPAPPALDAALRRLPTDYARTLTVDSRALISRYRVVDAARHAVGVGSVGTQCFVLLLEGEEAGDPLFLQAKEARASVLEPHGRARRASHHGRRVVTGQRLLQAGSDALLGWATLDTVGVYVRQLRDMRGGVDLASLPSGDLPAFAALCGEALARGHARTGRSAAIAGYLGDGDVFDDAVRRFARAYADQTERDHAALRAAADKGALPLAR
jgi:uncharacterized protein (DUF2252 family)